MIQRKQTLLLLLALLCNITFFFVPFAQTDTGVYLLNFSAPQATPLYQVLCVLNVALSILTLVNIFLYKKRNVQFKIANLTALFFCCFLFLFKTNSVLNTPAGTTWVPFLGLIGTFASFVAGKMIKKDEKLVRSADRIR
ncbi:MAG: DUF4293 family protein [Bacteroidetes bacterium]|nr:DUF4293 family protein [Bacteroidota bacterium]